MLWFSAMRAGVELFGTTDKPRCTDHFSRTWQRMSHITLNSVCTARVLSIIGHQSQQ